MQQQPTPGRCTSGPNNTCQFSGQFHVHEHEGRFYCEAHAPLSSLGKISAVQLNVFIQRNSNSSEAVDLRGIVFPVLEGQLYRFTSRTTDARGCTFEGGTKLQLEGDCDISGSTCLGEFEIYPYAVELTAHRVNFLGNASIVCNGTKRIYCTESTANREFSVTGLVGKTTTHLSGLTLSLAPVISVNENPGVMPQDTNLRGLILRKTAYGDGAEARYRAIRNLFNASRDREQEGIFYMYERRALRKSLPLRDYKSWIPRFFSACYDLLARYGQSFEWAFLWLLGVQIAFALMYSIKSDRFGLSYSIDWQVIGFTLA
jgi:hypothetical protein